MPRVLHICADFANQRIWVHLISELRKAGATQAVYAAVRSAAEAAWGDPALAGVPIHLRHILAPRHRILFRTKIRRIYRDLGATVDLSSFDVVHAHFLYSDGAVALRLKRERGIPYVAAVRNADVNAFMRFRPDLSGIRDDVLRGASKVVFLSPAYRDLVLARLSGSLAEDVSRKTLIVPNGVAPVWLTPTKREPHNVSDTLRLLYVGDFSRNKNLANVFRAVKLLSASRRVRLTLVGGGGEGDGADEVRRLLASGQYPEVEDLGRIDDEQKLQGVYRRHDMFVMPSFTETFGVVYAEALSQGLPLIHSHGQGVDGYFASGTVSEAVDPKDPVDIARKIEILSGRLPGVVEMCVEQSKRFDWSHIARTYVASYAGVLGEQVVPPK
jgi:glycosyltransferase involved in cell wall biosynthesis